MKEKKNAYKLLACVNRKVLNLFLDVHTDIIDLKSAGSFYLKNWTAVTECTLSRLRSDSGTS